MTSLPELCEQPRDALVARAAAQGLGLTPHLGHDQLVAELALDQLARGAEVWTEGELSTLYDGFGFVRLARYDYGESAVDAYVSPRQIRALGLRHGHRVRGRVRAPRDEERFLALLEVEAVQGTPVRELGDVAPFEALEVAQAARPLAIGGDSELDALAAQAPWRLGDRVLVHTSPSFGAATWLRRVADAAVAACPAAAVTVCLLEQRPEELAAARAGAAGAGVRVVGAAFAEAPRRLTQLADLALHAAMRDVERGRDALLLFDSLAALTHAHARSEAPSGAWIQPGLDARAPLAAKRLLAAARQVAAGGSLTVIATTRSGDSPLEQAIASEFLSTSNSDVWPEHPERSRTRPRPTDRS